MSQFKFSLIAVLLCSLSVFGNDSTPPANNEIKLIPVGASDASQSSNTDGAVLSVVPSSKGPSSTVEAAAVPSSTNTKAVPDSSLEPLNTTSSTTTSTTTTTTTTTTTPAPSPTPSPTPTPAPKPLPPADPGMWSFTDIATNVTCILVQFAAQLNVTYTKENSNTTANFQLNVPKNATVVNGSCANDSQWIQLSWPVSENSSNTMLLVFQVNETTKWYELKSLNVSLVPEVFHNSSFKEPVELWHGVEWHSPLATSYRCAPPTYLNMTGETANVVAKLMLSQLQEEAFRSGKDKTFSAARECGGDDLPDAVPIAVGCALGGLVVVVLVAYLVGRRRSAARGYLSM